MHMTPILRAAALSLVALTATASAAHPANLTATPTAGDAVVVKAGIIHLVEVGEIIRDGAVLVEGGKIVAVGTADSVKVPGGAEVARGCLRFKHRMFANTCANSSILCII